MTGVNRGMMETKDFIEKLIELRTELRELELIPELKGQLIHDASFKLAQGIAIQKIDDLLHLMNCQLNLETGLFTTPNDETKEQA